MSKTQNVFSFLRTALISENQSDRIRELEAVGRQVEWYEKKGEEFIKWYWEDRRAKQALIQERIVAKSEDCEQTDLEEFEKLLCQEKPCLGPNIDFFTIEELQELCTKFRQEKGHFSVSMSGDLDGAQSRVSRRSSSISARSSSSMADLFEKNLNSATTGDPASIKNSKRRNTRKLEGTMLSRQNAIVCRVSKYAFLIDLIKYLVVCSKT
jgi:hypothetical protein